LIDCIDFKYWVKRPIIHVYKYEKACNAESAENVDSTEVVEVIWLNRAIEHGNNQKIVI